ncbi:hypothetical protein LINPERHAP2_LOCUS40468 [Linum perenne]
MVKQACKCKPYNSHGVLHPGANPTATTERYELEIQPLVIDRTTPKPLGVELLGIGPVTRITTDGPSIDDDPSTRWYLVAIDFDGLSSFPRNH